MSLAPYDAVLLLAFGGPEGPDDVLPFLYNVTRGRDVPPRRLADVAEQYRRFGGRSPINDQNRALVAALTARLRGRGLQVPVFWGNRNWHPFLEQALREAYQAGCRRVLTLVTSAYASYPGCRQYREDLARALAALAVEGGAPQVDKVRPYFNHPGLVEQVTDAATAGLAGLPDGSQLLFVTHSLPVAVARTSGPAGGAYLAQHRDLAATVAATVAVRVGQQERPPDLAFCSRSGPPSQPWLEPDVNERLEQLHHQGVPGVLVVPIGFVSDHVEVAYDLDVQARATASRLGLPFGRAATPGTDPRFVAGLVDLLLERAAVERGEHPPRAVAGRLPAGHDVCPVGCCPSPHGPRPAACGADWPGAGAATR